MTNYKQLYHVQKWHAENVRGIPWKLTYDEWFSWWEQTGHLQDRGRGKGKYVMARFNDTGAYEIGNIKCILNTDNVSEAHLGTTRTAKHRENIGKANKGRIGPMLGKKHTQHSKDKVSASKLGVPATGRYAKGQVRPKQPKASCLRCKVTFAVKQFTRHTNLNKCQHA